MDNKEDVAIDDLMSGDYNFATVPKDQRAKLIKKWRDNDIRAMKTHEFKFFQKTNFMGAYRVNQRGSISLQAHGSSSRRRLTRMEIDVFSGVAGVPNPDWNDGDAPDPSDIGDIDDYGQEKLDAAEDRAGGGSKFYVIPKIVELARQQLSD